MPVGQLLEKPEQIDGWNPGDQGHHLKPDAPPPKSGAQFPSSCAQGILGNTLQLRNVAEVETLLACWSCEHPYCEEAGSGLAVQGLLLGVL